MGLLKPSLKHDEIGSNMPTKTIGMPLLIVAVASLCGWLGGKPEAAQVAVTAGKPLLPADGGKRLLTMTFEARGSASATIPPAAGSWLQQVMKKRLDHANDEAGYPG